MGWVIFPWIFSDHYTQIVFSYRIPPDAFPDFMSFQCTAKLDDASSSEKVEIAWLVQAQDVFPKLHGASGIREFHCFSSSASSTVYQSFTDPKPHLTCNFASLTIL